ncbi:ABC transporter ATP-binding protein [Jatrophihabitans endophyticus]|uniref:dipeptide ABC transporter ATP-binding protein n=1 Tax=Jatrophihabitans endophyticus TaxID=1206085 RepID=UPI0019EDBEF3|nr:ABC transporter ATP-binding protein [Jatrophihabitans endophyticus]MBE7187087.1 ABC transporter ATP-binding protein [Jatrophihabitans endophyticus]
MTSADPTDPAVPTLRIDELSIDFPGAGTVVDSVSFDVRPGEVVALVGESGSGKSVTAKAILGLLPDTATSSGSVQVNGDEVLGLDDAQLRAVRGAKVAMVFQEPGTALNPVEKVGWQIGEALRAHRRISRREARARAVELLTLVEIPDPETRVDHYPHQLSGGQRQRVVIALALANEPDLIIADEPTTALDVTVQAEILTLLHDLRARLGRAVLLITHNMGVVADLADRVIVLRHGVVVESDSADAVFSRPRAAYTKELLAAVPKLEPAVSAAAAGISATDAVVDFAQLVVEYPGRLGQSAFTAIHEVDLSVTRGEVLGLVGESGSGKSTLGRVAVGLMKPKAGRATVLGQELSSLSRSQLRDVRRRIGMVFQDPAASLDPLRSVGDAISEPIEVHGLARGAELRARVVALLESVHLPASYADRRPVELSGGQRQRVGLARALALDPELVVADEPTSALDVVVQARVLDLFGELRERFGFACLFISHDLAVVDRVADRVAVLREGSVVEVGEPAKVLRNPATGYTRHLIDAVPAPDPAIQRRKRARVA